LINNKKYDSFIKLDIESFFPNIDHHILLDMIEKKIKDKKAISLLKKGIKKYTISSGRVDKKIIRESNKGIPQGLSFSNILSDIYLAKIDKKYLKSKKMEYFRFVDDILIARVSPYT
jgi:retron-type reverse transcriptase